MAVKGKQIELLRSMWVLQVIQLIFGGIYAVISKNIQHFSYELNTLIKQTC